MKANSHDGVIVAVTDGHLFSVGDWITVGTWPAWMWWLHLPGIIRIAIQNVCEFFGKHIGPTTMVIGSIDLKGAACKDVGQSEIALRPLKK